MEHHPSQGATAVQLIAFDYLATSGDADARAVATAVGLQEAQQMAWAEADPVEPLADLVELIDDDLLTVQSLDPYKLGATISVAGDSSNYGRHDPYVPRTANQVDEKIDAALAGAQLVLLVGPSKAGKSRTAYEALRRNLPTAHVAVPQPGKLSALTLHPRWQTTDDMLVVFLDDLQRYINHTDPLTPALLARLRRRPGRVVMVATLRSEERSRLRDSTFGELTRDSRMLLEQAKTMRCVRQAQIPLKPLLPAPLILRCGSM